MTLRTAALAVIAIAIIVAACGGDGDNGEVRATTPGGHADKENEPRNCAGTWPSGEVAFRGEVLDVREEGGHPVGATFLWTEVDVLVGEIRTVPDTLYPYEYVPGDVITVIVLDQSSVSATIGNCVIVSGAVSRWACGAACDAAGFVAEEFAVTEASE